MKFLYFSIGSISTSIFIFFFNKPFHKTMETIFSSIPSTLWSVAIGGCIGLGGVILTNRNNKMQLDLQLTHDEKIKKIERNSLLRREVYLNAAEEFVNVMTYISSLPMIDFTQPILENGLKNFMVSTSKLNLVAEEETMRASYELFSAVNVLYLKAMEMMMPLTDIQIKAKGSQSLLNIYQAEVDRSNKLIQLEHNSGQPNFDAIKSLQISYDINVEEVKKMHEEIIETGAEMSKFKMGFIKFILTESNKMRELQTPLMVAIRKELGIMTDIDNYQELLNKLEKKLIDQINQFITSIEAKITEPEPSDS